MSENSTKEHKPGMPFDLQWGGYYAYKNNEGLYSTWRLLDFNVDALHYALYDTNYDHMPILEEVQQDRPFIGHVPQAVTVLFNQKSLTLLGGDALTKDDLEGYMLYLEHARGAPQEYILTLTEKLIQFSNKKTYSRIMLFKDSENENRIKIGT